MRRVVAALYPRTLATSLAMPMDVLQAAGEAARAGSHPDGAVTFQLAGAAPVKTVGGLTLQPDIPIADLPGCDMLLLPAMWRNPRPVLREQVELLALLPRLAAEGTVICCVGTASCFLAECGLLDDRAATTHWNYFREFERRYPRVGLKKRHLITQSDNLYCAGSVNSIVDLMIHLVEGWFGQRIARAIESQFSPEIRRPFRAHAWQSLDDSAHHDELVLSAQQWLQDRLHTRVTMSALAEAVQCNPRTLNRRFRAATGQTPSLYLRNQRITAAKELLRATNLSVGEVAWQVGLQDVSYFTSLFHRELGTTPARYRRSVRGKLFTPGL